MSVLNSIEDLRQLARRRVPRAIFDYADRGSYDEVTFNRNLADLAAIQLRQRVMVDVSNQQLATTVLGEQWSMPCGIGPTGLFHANGEMLGRARRRRSASRSVFRRCPSVRSKTCAVRCRNRSGSRST